MVMILLLQVYTIIQTSMAIIMMLISQYTITSSILPGHRNWQEVLGVCLTVIATIVTSLGELTSSRK